MTDALLECESIRQSFRQWHSEQETLDAELAESLSALSAYQTHLDAWQQQLARERDGLQKRREDVDRESADLQQTQELLSRERGELQKVREQLDRERVDFEKNQAASSRNSTELSAELAVAREKISSLSTSLLERTEELRTLDQRRAETVTELELARAREKQLQLNLENQRQVFEKERSHWSEELRQMRSVLERRAEPTAPVERDDQPQRAPQHTAPPPEQRAAPTAHAEEQPGESPVLGSIMEQFGKLRQQRATDRQAFKKSLR